MLYEVITVLGRRSAEETWKRIVSRDALVAEGSIEGLQRGDRYAITTVHGDRLQGEVLINQRPMERNNFV